MVVMFGLAVGFSMVESLSPADGDHVYFAPPLARSCMLVPEQIAVLLDTFATIMPTVTRTVSVATQPVAFVTVTMYSVVVLGETVGFGSERSFTAILSDHK